MQSNYFKLSTETQREILNGAQSKLNVRNIILEKDIWICWFLNELFFLPKTMSFKGGTSLSKVFGLIKRFSEDLDITIDYRNFSEFDHLDNNSSKSALKKLSAELKNNTKNYVENFIVPHFKERLATAFPDALFKIDLGKDGEHLRIFYPTLFNQEEHYLQNSVLLEFGGRNTTEPSETHFIETILSQATRDLELPAARIKVLSPLRTFWEKATLIHVECSRGRLQESPDRLFRHWYDLAMLAQSWVGSQALENRELLKDVVLHKTAFFNSNYANYDQCINGNFLLIPTENELRELKKDFDKMQGSGMFPEEPLEFNEIIETLRALEQSLKKQCVNL